ncbi:MAG: TolC family protein, partial [Verrucomicrobiota bacterium]|jgi:cobalt-zinc-cadmium efflux system outer membrane protein
VRNLVATLLIVTAFWKAQAQTNILSLADAKQIAFAQNWSLLAAKSGVDAAEAQLIIAKEFPNPTVSLSTYKIGEQNAGTPLGNGLWQRNYDSYVAVSQFFEIAGKRRDRQLAARAGVLSARARFYDAKRTLDQGVTKAYVAALLAGENERNLTQSAGYMRHEATIAEAQHAAGDLSEADMKTIEINAEQFELQAKSAAAAAVQARIGVEVLMGVTRPGGNWAPDDSLEQLVTAAAALAESNMNTNADRPDVLAAKTDLRAAEENLKLQKAERIPDPTFFIGAEHNPPGESPDVNTFNLGVSFPLPIWNLNGGNIKAAKAAVAQSRIAFEQLKAQAVADLASAESEYDEAHSRWLSYRDQTVPKSAKVRETIEFKYEKGAATLVDLLNAEQTDNAIRLAFAQAMNDTAGAAADLSAASLTLTEAQLNSNQWK